MRPAGSDHRGGLPHHLLFHVGDYDRLGSLIQMNPSIKDSCRQRRTLEGPARWADSGRRDRSRPHTLEEKRQPYPKSPSGLPAGELAGSDAQQPAPGPLYAGADRPLDVRCPSRVWDIVNKGRIAEGYDPTWCSWICTRSSLSATPIS